MNAEGSIVCHWKSSNEEMGRDRSKSDRVEETEAGLKVRSDSKPGLEISDSIDV